jgi:hypothetical protein
MLKGKMSVSVVITSFVGFPSPCPLGVTSLSQWAKQLEFKADHFHIVFILRINGTFLSLPLYSFMALCLAQGYKLHISSAAAIIWLVGFCSYQK